MNKRLFILTTLIICIIFPLNCIYAEKVQWKVEDGGNGHYYDHISAPNNWYSAKAYAESLGGYLCTVTSKEENDFITNTFTLNYGHGAWFGAFQNISHPDYSEPAGGWTWVTGESWNYTNWRSGEPNNFGPINEVVCIMYAEPAPLGTWGDYGNGYNEVVEHLLVEWGDIQVPPESDPPENLPLPPESSIRDQLINLIPENPLNQNKPTIVIVHGWRSNINGWVSDMGEAIKNRLFGLFNIVAWDWEEEADTDIIRVLPRAIDQGSLLAERLQNEGITKWLHMIGHSAGAKLIEEAARILNINNFEVEQLTFLDYLVLGNISGTFANWADNYESSIGGRHIDDAFNYVLSSNDHPFAHDFYIESINGLWPTVGFYWSIAGGGDEERPPINTVIRQETGSESTLSIEVNLVESEDFSNIGEWNKSGNVYLDNGTAILKEASSAYLFKTMTIPENAYQFKFDFLFRKIGDGDYLVVYFNEILLYWFNGEHFPGNQFFNSHWISIEEYSGKTGIFTFALISKGDINSEVWLDNLEFYNILLEEEDNTPPIIICPSDIQAEQNDKIGTIIELGIPYVYDAIDTNPIISNDAPEIFLLGKTIVKWTATDFSGNYSFCYQEITIVDTTPPSIIDIQSSPNKIWPPNHKMVPVTISCEIDDISDINPKWKIVNVISNQTENDCGDGNQEIDWEIISDHTVNLRAERASCIKDDRVYTITIECSDFSENISNGTVEVIVPHDCGKANKK